MKKNNGTILVFQNRRKRFLKHFFTFSLPSFIIGFLMCWYAEKFMPPINDSIETMIIFIIGFVIAASGIFSFTHKAYKDYRCPKCSAVPMGSFKGVGTSGFVYMKNINLNPSECPNCGTKLK